MNMYLKRKLKTAAGAVLFALCVALIVIGQRAVGWGWLGLMLVGLCGILALLYAYNRSVEKPKREGPAQDKVNSSEV